MDDTVGVEGARDAASILANGFSCLPLTPLERQPVADSYGRRAATRAPRHVATADTEIIIKPPPFN